MSPGLPISLLVCIVLRIDMVAGIGVGLIAEVQPLDLRAGLPQPTAKM